MEFRWALAAFLGVLVFGTLQGIVVAVVLSLLGLASQAAHPRVRVIGRKRGEDVLRPLSPEHPDDETFEGLLIVRPEGRLFFANAEQVGDRLRELVAEHRPRVLDPRPQPGLRHRVFRAAGDDQWRAALCRRGRDRLAGRPQPGRAGRRSSVGTGGPARQGPPVRQRRRGPEPIPRGPARLLQAEGRPWRAFRGRSLGQL